LEVGHKFFFVVFEMFLTRIDYFEKNTILTVEKLIIYIFIKNTGHQICFTFIKIPVLQFL
jgi:hypothetical protein